MTTYSATHDRTWSIDTIRVGQDLRVGAARLVLAAAVAVGLVLRLGALDTYGLSDDEINKANAVDGYRAGQFSANSEHPMLMKLAMWGSGAVADAWNRVNPDRQISHEAALRAPNAVAGAATTAVIFGVADVLFGGAAAVAASSIWAVDVNAIAINRIGKEDTFLLLFFLIAVWCYERGKQAGRVDLESAQRWYRLSGAAFGLMLASKYMPHLFGIYAIFNLVTDREPGANKPNVGWFYGLMAVTFLAANPAVLMPSTWRYIAHYVHGDMLAHHGYSYLGALYVTDVPVSPLGVPPTYYLRLLATKVPLVVLAAAIPGLIEIIRRRHDRGFVLLRVLAVFLVVPYSLMAAKFLRYSLPMLAVLDMIAAVGLVAGVSWLLRKRWLSQATRLFASAAALVVFCVGVARPATAAAPFYSLFQNGVGVALDPRGAAFPEDAYDYGVREAVAAIAATAERDAVIVSDVPSIVRHYIGRTGRSDLHALSLSSGPVPPAAAEIWLIAQDEHATFENDLLLRQLQARERPWLELRVDARVMARVYRIEGRR